MEPNLDGTCLQDVLGTVNYVSRVLERAEVSQAIQNSSEDEVQEKTLEVKTREKRLMDLLQKKKALEESFEEKRRKFHELADLCREVREENDVDPNLEAIHRMIYKINLSRQFTGIVAASVTPTSYEKVMEGIDLASKVCDPRDFEFYEKKIRKSSSFNRTSF